jgi:hypothetical protein
LRLILQQPSKSTILRRLLVKSMRAANATAAATNLAIFRKPFRIFH